MVHRDIKPQNLMLTPKGEIKILDFGLARFVSEQGPAGGSTAHGALMGSPDYMAPEQGQDAHSADARADIYSMGCTLYQMLAGQVPFPESSLLQKLEAHRDQPPLRLDHVRSDVPAELASVVEKMLAKDPARRYQVPAEVAEALRPFTQVQLTSPQASDSSTSRLASAPTYRKPIFALAIAAGLLLLGSGYWLAQILLRVETPNGTLIIKSDDPSVRISVKSGGKEVILFFPKEKKEIPLKVGEYTIDLVQGKDGLKLSTKNFRIESGQGKTVTVEFEPLIAQETPKKTSDRSKSPTPHPFPFTAKEGQEKQQQWADFLGRKVVETNSENMKLAMIPTGEFSMTPDYRVRLTKAFYLGAHEVTVGQFRRFVKETGHKTDAEVNGGGRIDDFSTPNRLSEPKPEYVWTNRDFAPTDEHPAVFVSSNDAQKFCAWLSLKEKKTYRLPTEAEWEWASRAGTIYDAKSMSTVGWVPANSDKKPHPVGKLTANTFGIFDMFGNVSEHCQDWYHKDSNLPAPTGFATDPQGPPQGKLRVVRGGSYDWDPGFGVFTPTLSMHHTGFRVVCEVAGPDEHPTEPVVPTIPTVEELLKTREVLKVAQDGSERFKTIGEALDAVGPHQVILVLDKGPYRELLSKALPADVALVSLVGTRIEIPKYEPYGEAHLGKQWYFGAWLNVQPGFRLSGFEWVMALPRPADLHGGRLVCLGADGDVLVEKCSFQAPDYLTGLTCFTLPKTSARILAQENVSNQCFEFHEFPGSITVQRNWVSSTLTSAIILNQRAGKVVVRHNVLTANWGLTLNWFAVDKSQTFPGVDLTIHNNILDVADGPIGILNSSKGYEPCVLPRAALIANNIIRSRSRAGVLMIPEDRERVKTRWTIGPNAYQSSFQKVLGSPYESWPTGPRDQILARHFLSITPKDADYLRIAADGPLAKGGAGGELPSYFGAFSPGPAPRDGDWFTRSLAKHAKEATK